MIPAWIVGTKGTVTLHLVCHPHKIEEITQQMIKSLTKHEDLEKLVLDAFCAVNDDDNQEQG